MEGLKTLFKVEMEKQPTIQQLSSWHLRYGKQACNQCRALQVPCTPPAQLLTTVDCANCTMRGLLCSRKIHERQLHVREALKIDQATVIQLHNIVSAEIRQQNQQQQGQGQGQSAPIALPVDQQGLPTHIDPRVLMNPTSTSNSEIPTVHLPLFLPQPQPQLPFPQQGYAASPYPPSVPQPQSSSVASLDPQSSSVSSVFNGLSSIVNELEHANQQNEKQRSELALLQSSYQNLQAGYDRLHHDYIQLQSDHSQRQVDYTNLETTHSQLQTTHTSLQQFVAKMKQEVPIRFMNLSSKNQALEKELNEWKERGQKAQESVATLQDQVERDLQRKLSLEEQVGSLRSELEKLKAETGNNVQSTVQQAGLDPNAASNTDTEDQLQLFQDARQKREEGYLHELANLKETLEMKEREICDQLNRSNKLISERSRDYTMLKGLLLSFGAIRDGLSVLSRIGVDMGPTMKSCADCGKQLELLAEKMRGDMLVALCVDNTPRAEVLDGEKQGEAEDLSRWLQNAEAAAEARLGVSGAPVHQQADQEMAILEVGGTGVDVNSGMNTDEELLGTAGDTLEPNPHSSTSRPAKRMRVQSEPDSDDSEIEILAIIRAPS
ncbi:hypothetical protein PM082_016940 [Marasmius tenuissimus]|nr:hypothetical protein PM082_016940 [Marasmius tenuissimus]